jgi:cardiolipin synthase A/B
MISILHKLALLGIMVLCSGVRAQVVSTPGERSQALQSELVSPRFQAQLDLVTHSKIVPGNQVQLLLNGMMSYPVRYALIEKAKESIVMVSLSIYAQWDSSGDVRDELSRKMVDLLLSAKRRGVKVLVLTDGGTSIYSGSHAAIDRLRAGGIEVVKYNPVIADSFDVPLLLAPIPGLVRALIQQSAVTNRWHEKTLVVDGTYAVTGGLNWGELYGYGNQYSGAQYQPDDFFNSPLVKEVGAQPTPTWGKLTDIGWRDTDILIKGPVVTEMQQRLLFDFGLLDVLSGRATNSFADATDADYELAKKVAAEKYVLPTPPESELKTEGGLGLRYITQRPALERQIGWFRESLPQARAWGVYQNKKNPHLSITNYYINVINKSERQILWGCHSNLFVDDLSAAVLAAAQRGVKIFLTTNSIETAATLSDGGFFMYRRAVCQYRELLKQGRGNIRIFEWQGQAEVNGQTLHSGAFHSKVFVADGVLTSVGSYNPAPASYGKHTEGTVAVIDGEFARAAEEMYERDLRFTKEITLENVTSYDQAFCNNPDEGGRED